MQKQLDSPKPFYFLAFHKSKSQLLVFQWLLTTSQCISLFQNAAQNKTNTAKCVYQSKNNKYKRIASSVLLHITILVKYCIKWKKKKFMNPNMHCPQKPWDIQIVLNCTIATTLQADLIWLLWNVSILQMSHSPNRQTRSSDGRNRVSRLQHRDDNSSHKNPWMPTNRFGCLPNLTFQSISYCA